MGGPQGPDRAQAGTLDMATPYNPLISLATFLATAKWSVEGFLSLMKKSLLSFHAFVRRDGEKVS